MSDPTQAKLVVVLMKKLEGTLEVEGRMSQTVTVLTSVAYSKVEL